MEGYLNLALNCIANMQYKLAESYLESSEKTPKYYYVQGTLYFRQLKYTDALEQFKNIPLDDPVLKEAMHCIVETYKKLHQFPEALRVAELAVKQYPDYYKSYAVRGSVLADMKKYQQAIKDLALAIEINPQAKEAKQNIIWSYCKLGDYIKTMELYNAYLKENEKESKYLQYKAKLLSNFKRYDEAMDVIDKILDREPYNPKYRRDKVICLYHQEKYDLCIKEGLELINIENPKLSEEMAQLNFYVAVSYLRKHNNREKYDYHMELFKKDIPERIRNNEYFIEEAKRLFEMGKSEEGMKLVNRVLVEDPEFESAIIMKINYFNNHEPKNQADKDFYNKNKDYENKLSHKIRQEYIQSQIQSELTSSNFSNQSSTKGIYNNEPQSQIKQELNDNNYSQMGINQNSVSILIGNQKVQFENLDRKNIIGQGGFSIVYTQKMPDNKMTVFKEIKSTNNILVTIKDEELDILKKFNHPNIVKYLGFYNNSIIMEYCEGKDLYSLLISRKAKVSVKFKYHIILQIAEALDYIHDKNIIHGDLKTKNVLLDKEYNPDNWPNAKLCDFGLSITNQHADKSKGFTINYAPPEVFGLNTEITIQSDIYSFGMTIYEIITQQVPFNDKGDLQTVEMNEMIKKSVQRGIHPNFEKDIDPSVYCKELVKLINIMCSKLPDSRPTIKQVLTAMKEIMRKY